MTQTAYNRERAVEYALEHWNNPNPAFANMSSHGSGGDCTNFTSQSLWAGGWPMDYRETGYHTEWWYRRTSSEPFDRNQDDWWSCTWSLAENQFHYLSHNCGTVYDLRKGREDIRCLDEGDIIYYDWNGDGRLDHSALVTAIDLFGRPRVTYRTGDPLEPVRNRHWELLFRRYAPRILAVHLHDDPHLFSQPPNWSRLTPCYQSRA